FFRPSYIGAFGGLIAFGVQNAHPSIQNWRILLKIEGIPTVLIGIAIFFLLPNRPESITLFDGRERAIALDRMNREVSGPKSMDLQQRRIAHILLAFRDWRFYAGDAFLELNCTLASVSPFLPTIITTFGFSSYIQSVQWLSFFSYSDIALHLCSRGHTAALLSFTSDRLQSRGIFMVIASLISGVDYVYPSLQMSFRSLNLTRWFPGFCLRLPSMSMYTLGAVRNEGKGPTVWDWNRR
ncbi:hypothetical protein DFH06DRAFT_1010802, partial [Mycena polygramma]